MKIKVSSAKNAEILSYRQNENYTATSIDNFSNVEVVPLEKSTKNELNYATKHSISSNNSNTNEYYNEEYER